MLTANQFDRIKTSIKEWKATSVGDLTLEMIGTMLVMLEQCAAEIDRYRAVPEVSGRGHLKPVVLDAQGQAVMPAPIAHQLAVERREQYDIDRFQAIMAIPDIGPWRVFSLRWGLTPPPGGWEDTDMLLRVIHSVRLVVKQVPVIAKLSSASWLKSQGIALPPGVTLQNGVLSGVELPD